MEIAGRPFLSADHNALGIVFTENDPKTIRGRNNAEFNSVPITLSCFTPLYQSCDQRVSVSVSAHLPMMSRILIKNGKQSTSREIAKAYIENHVETTLTFENNNFTGLRVKSKSFADQTHLIKQTDQYKTWVRLLESYDVQLLRFYLHITYKLFQNDSFIMTTEDFPIDDENFWQMTVQFVSDY